MKTLTLLILLLLTAPLAAGIALEDTIELGDVWGWSAGRGTKMLEISDDWLIIFDEVAAAAELCRLRIVSTDGLAIDSITWPCTYPLDLDYKGGRIVTCSSYSSTGFKHDVRIWSWPEEGYLNPEGQYYISGADSLTSLSSCKLKASSAIKAEVYVKSVWYAGARHTGELGVWYNGSSDFTDLPMTLPNTYEGIYDFTENVVQYADSFINITDIENTSVLDTLVTSSGEIVAWNENTFAPRWATDDGHIVLTDDYTNIVESSGDVTLDDIFAMQGKYTVHGVLDGWWYEADFTNAGTPTLTNMSVEATNWAASAAGSAPITQLWSKGDTRIYIMNQTNQILTMWTYEDEETCVVAEGCYLDDEFSYATSVLSNGWSGSDTYPTDGEYVCDGETTGSREFNWYDITPVTTDTLLITADLSFCSGSKTNFHMSMGTGSEAAFVVNIDSDGNIRNAGDEAIGVFPTTCDSYENHSTLEVVVYPDNNPKSYSVYVDEVLQSAGESFTTDGQNNAQLSWIKIDSNLVNEYCNYSLDSISIYSLAADSTPEAIAISEFTVGALYIEPGNSSFDWTQCRTGENRNACFLRLTGGSSLDWVWNSVIKNPLTWLALVFLIIIIVFMKSKNE